MARPIPPMYGKVRRKTPPPQRQIVVKTAEQIEAERQAAEKAAEEAAKAAKKAERARKKAEKDAGKGAAKVADKAAKGAEKVAKKAKKSAKKVTEKAANKFPKWSPDDNKDKLYKLAKKLGLNVDSRDTKDWIVKQLKKAEKKAGG